MDDLPKTIHGTLSALESGETTAEAVVEATFKRIDQWEPHIHAFLELLKDHAMEEAKKSDQKRKEKKPVGRLEGIPIAIKDNILTRVGHTTAASKLLENFKSTYDATVITKLQAEGAIVIGKTNLDEFAMGSSTEFSAFGPTKNPWDTSRVSGGSSGGSIAAVASGEVLAALGTDTGGSVRQPASFCSAVGLKPTYGRVSRFGAIAYGSSLDQISPVASSVEDVATLLSVMAGQDPLDATSSPEIVPTYLQEKKKDLKGVKVGVPKEFMSEHIAPDVREVIEQAITDMKEQGAEIVEISLPLTDAGIAVYFLIAKAEASTNLARFDALRFGKMDLESTHLIERYMEARGKGFGPEVKRAILMGTYALSAGYYDAWYKQASRVRTLITREYEEAFKQVDIIAGPVSPEVAFKFGSKTDDPLQMYLADALTVPLSVAGVPAISVPAGFTKEGLPVGLQLAGLHFREDKVLNTAYAYEQAHDWYTRFPNIK